jgi:hypothetical protein
MSIYLVPYEPVPLHHHETFARFTTVTNAQANAQTRKHTSKQANEHADKQASKQTNK